MFIGMVGAYLFVKSDQGCLNNVYVMNMANRNLRFFEDVELDFSVCQYRLFGSSKCHTVCSRVGGQQFARIKEVLWDRACA